MTPALAALSLIAAQAQLPAQPSLDQLWLLQAGDDACAFFEPPGRALLDAAISRARDDEVRAGVEPRRLDAAQRTLRSRGQPACTDAALERLVDDHRSRIAALADYSDLTFPGTERQWRVDRGPVRPGRAAEPRWRVSQLTRDGEAWFGVYEVDGEMHLAVAFNDPVRYARSALSFRDREREPYPLDFTAGGLLPAPDSDPAASWGAGARGLRRSTASGRMSDEAAAYLAPAGGAPAHGFEFPETALRSLAELTPRDGAAIELYDRTGVVVRRIWVEIGALKAALALQAIPLPEREPTGARPAL